MKIRKIATAALLASVALSPVSPVSAPARADGKDFIAGAIIGGIIGGAVANENNKKKSTKSTKAKSTKPSISAEQKAANKEVQTALNYFGYPVGTPDGAIGPKSRAAISEYQAFLGYPATGELTEHERTILVTSYHRAVAGGPVIAEAVAGSVYGLKAVLIAQRDEMAGVAPGGTLAAGAVAPGGVAAAAAAALPKLAPEAPVVEEAAVAPEPEPEAVAEPEVAVAAAEPALPSFMSPAGAKGSLAATCDQIGVATTRNGGLTTADGMQDANFALGEQFCLARTFAMAKGDELTAQIAGFTPDQIAQQCAAFGPVLKDHVAALSLKPAGEVLEGVQGFIQSSGMSPAQLSGTAKVCLGAGYAQDDMEVAIGSALLLAAMGEKGYGEYLGHHLSQGFGASERPDLAMDWYQMALDAMGQGQLVVAPGMAGRDALLKKASYTVGGRASELEPEAEVQEAALPVFDLAPAAPVVEDAAAPVVAAPVTEEAAAPVVEAPVVEAPVVEEAAVVAPPEPMADIEVAEVPQVAEPIFVAPSVAGVTGSTPAPIPAPVAVAEGPDTSIVNAGAQAAAMAARLPFLIFSSY